MGHRWVGAIVAAAALLWWAWPSGKVNQALESGSALPAPVDLSDEPGTESEALVAVDERGGAPAAPAAAAEESSPEEPEADTPVGPSYIFAESTGSRLRMGRWSGAIFGPGLPEAGSDSAPVRKGRPSSLAFPDPLVPEGTRGPWRMVVTSEGGLRVGTGAVYECDGACSEPVDLVFEDCGGLHFSLARSAVPPIVELTPYGPGEALEVALGEVDGRWVGSIFKLLPGVYSWQLRGGTDAQRGDVEVRSLDRRWVHIPAAGDGDGEPQILIDATAAPAADLSMWKASLRPREDGAALLGLHPLRARDHGVGYWALRPGALDGGSWVLRMDARKGFRAEPVMLAFDVPGPSPVVTVSPVEMTEAVFRVVNDETGEPVFVEPLLLMDGVAATVVRGDLDGRVVVDSVPVDRETTLMVRASGYQLVAVTVPAAARHAEREVRLRRGWRGRVRTLGPAGMSPVGGVSVHVDGELAGTTDERGVLWLSKAPERSVLIAADNAHLRVLHDLGGGGTGPPHDWIGGYVYLMERVD